MPAFRLLNGKYYGTSVAALEAKPARVAGAQAMPIPLPYKVDGERIIVEKPGGAMVLYILPNQVLHASGTTHRYVRHERPPGASCLLPWKLNAQAGV